MATPQDAMLRMTATARDDMGETGRSLVTATGRSRSYRPPTATSALRPPPPPNRQSLVSCLPAHDHPPNPPHPLLREPTTRSPDPANSMQPPHRTTAGEPQTRTRRATPQQPISPTASTQLSPYVPDHVRYRRPHPNRRRTNSPPPLDRARHQVAPPVSFATSATDTRPTRRQSRQRSTTERPTSTDYDAPTHPHRTAKVPLLRSRCSPGTPVSDDELKQQDTLVGFALRNLRVSLRELLVHQ